MLDVRHEVHVESLWGACLSIVQKHFGLAGFQPRCLTASGSKTTFCRSIGSEDGRYNPERPALAALTTWP